MKKSSKGALAGAAAAVLLMGGFGTHAAWNADGDVPGGNIDTGKLQISTPQCGDWLFGVVDQATGGFSGTPTTLTDTSSLLMIPGDLLTRHCTFTITVTGDHMSANLTVPAATVKRSNGTVVTELVANAVFKDQDHPTAAAITSSTVLSGTVNVAADISVEVPDTLDGLTGQGLDAALQSITIEATQAS